MTPSRALQVVARFFFFNSYWVFLEARYCFRERSMSNVSSASSQSLRDVCVDGLQTGSLVNPAASLLGNQEAI